MVHRLPMTLVSFGTSFPAASVGMVNALFALMLGLAESGSVCNEPMRSDVVACPWRRHTKHCLAPRSVACAVVINLACQSTQPNLQDIARSQLLPNTHLPLLLRSGRQNKINICGRCPEIEPQRRFTGFCAISAKPLANSARTRRADAAIDLEARALEIWSQSRIPQPFARELPSCRDWSCMRRAGGSNQRLKFAL